jgi:hypothetical protein
MLRFARLRPKIKICDENFGETVRRSHTALDFVEDGNGLM